jgi:hypothetical protein
MTLEKLVEVLRDGDTFLVKLPNKLKAMLKKDDTLLTQKNLSLGSIRYLD